MVQTFLDETGWIRLNWSHICNITPNLSLEKALEDHSQLFREGLGCLNTTTAKLFVTPHAQPKFYKARPVLYYLKAKIEQELLRQEKLGIIIPVKCSDWAAPIVPVLKANENLCLCDDYKVTINKINIS